ncbi:MAG: Na+/H+ antiporter [Gemmatimonadota bacterium]
MSAPTPIVELLLIAVAVAVATKYVRLPYTVALVLVGLALGAAGHLTPIELSRELIFFIFLPPLLFEGCLNMDLQLLLRNWRRVFLLAVPGTLASAFLLGVGVYYLFGWLGSPLALEVAVLLGVILSPTDPISVLAIFKEHGVAKELAIVVEGESVFNDGIGVVLFLIAVDVASGHPVTPDEAAVEFLREVAGGALIGFSLGYLTHRLLGAIDDHLIEVAISLVLAYGVYLVAERLGTSGVIAVVVAGLIIGNYGRVLSMAPTTRISLAHFWDVAAFIINSLLFLMIGLELELAKVRAFWLAIVASFLLMLAVRAAIVSGALRADRLLGGRRLARGWASVVSWGGVRGSIPIALTLGLPTVGLMSPALRAELLAVVFGTVFCSLVVQGLTMKPLLGRLGLIGLDRELRAYEEALGRLVGARAALRSLASAHREGELPDSVYDELRSQVEEDRKIAAAAAGRAAQAHEGVRRRQLGRAGYQVLRAQRAALDEAFRRGLLSQVVADALKREVNARLEEGSERGFETVWGGRPPEEPDEEQPATDEF